MSAQTPWTADEIAELRRLWTDGLLVREICQRMGRSSGAVVAKIDRLGLKSRSRESQSQAMRGECRAARTASPRLEKQRPTKEMVSGLICRTPFVELQAGQCKWPHGDRDILFCARPTRNNGPYCSHHVQKAFTPKTVMAKK